MAAGGGSDVLRQKSVAQRAEEIRRQRSSFEATKGQIEKLVSITKEIGAEFQGLSERESEIDKLATPTRMGDAYRLGQALVTDIGAWIQDHLKARLAQLSIRVNDLLQLGIPDTVGLKASVETGGKSLSEGAFSEAAATMKSLDAMLSGLEEKSSGLLKERVEDVLKWSFPDGDMADARVNLAPCLDLLEKNDLKGASACLEQTSRDKVPQVMNRLLGLADALGKALPVAKELGISTVEFEDLVATVPDTRFIAADVQGQRMKEASDRIWTAIRPHLTERLGKLRAVTDRLKEREVDVLDAVREIETIERQLGEIPPPEVLSRLDTVDNMIEGPLLRVVFGEVEEMRPYIEEARSMGRPIAGVIEGMNETRVLLNSKDYLKAFDVSSATLDRARRLLEDVELARSEIEEYKSLLFRLEVVGLSVADMQSYAISAEESASKGDFARAKESLREGAKLLGRQSTQFFEAQISAIERLIGMIEAKHGKVPEDVKARLEESRLLLSSTNIPGVLEATSDASAKVQASVKALLTERLDNLRSELDAVPDESVRHYLENTLTQVNTSFESVDQAITALQALDNVSHELTVTMASEVGKALVTLEGRQKNLEAMGIPTEETAKEVVQVRQILDTGDYLRALHSLADLSNRITQTAMSRAEEALTGAKLALVEVSKSISEPPDVKQAQDRAREEFQAGHYPEAYALATQAKESATAIQVRAQKIVEKIGHMVTQITTLRKKGAPVDDLRLITTRIAGVRESYQRLQFDKAEEILLEVQGSLQVLETRTHGLAKIEELRKVLEGAGSLGIYTTEWTEKIDRLATDLKGGAPEKTTLLVEELTSQIIDKIRPILEENVKGIESELRAAREEGLDIRETEGLFREAVEKLKAPLPVGAANALVELKKQFSQNRVLQEAAQKALNSARDSLRQAQMMNLEVMALEAKVEEANAKMAASEYGKALEISQEVRERTQGQVRGHLNQLIGNLQEVILRVKREGALTMVAENYIAQARNKIASGHTAEVLQFLGKAENELERAELQHSIAQNSLNNLASKLAEAKKNGVVSPDTEAEMGRARQQFDDGEYSKVMEAVLKVSDVLQHSEEMYRRADTAFGRAKGIMEAAATVGSNVGESGLARAESAMKEGRYAEAEALSREVWDHTREALEKDLSTRQKDLTPFVELVGPEESAGKSLASSLEEARRARTREEYATMARYLDSAVMAVITATGTFLKDETSRLKVLSEEGFMEPWKECMELVDVISDDMRMGNLNELSADWAKLKEKADAALSSYITTMADRLAEAAFVIERVGVDGGPIVETVQEARNALSEKEFDRSVDKIGEAKVKMDGELKHSLPDYVKGLRQSLQRASVGLNVSVAGLERELEDFDSLFTRGDFIASVRKVIDVEQALLHRKNWQKELQDAQYIVDSLVGQASGAGLDTSHTEKLIEETISFKSEGNYEKALQSIEQAKQELRSLLKME